MVAFLHSQDYEHAQELVSGGVAVWSMDAVAKFRVIEFLVAELQAAQMLAFTSQQGRAAEGRAAMVEQVSFTVVPTIA